MKKSKIIITLTLAIIAVLGLSLVAQAVASTIKVYVDGNAVNFSNTYGYPIIKDNRTFLPVRVTAEAMNAVVNWLPPSNVETKITGRTVLMTIGSASYAVNGVTNQMDVAPFLDESINRTYVPARFIADGLGYTMEWRQVNGVDYVFNFTKGQTQTERTAIMDKIAPVTTVPLPTDQANAVTVTIPDKYFSNQSYPEFGIVGSTQALGKENAPLVQIDSNSLKAYRFVCTNHPELNVHDEYYSDGTLSKDSRQDVPARTFTIYGAGYAIPLTKGMTLQYEVYKQPDGSSIYDPATVKLYYMTIQI